MTDPSTESLRVTTRQGTDVFHPGADVVIGRESGLSVMLAHEKVSRRHLTVSYVAGTGWVLTDSSSNGTFHDGVRIGRLVVSGPIALMLGNPVDGEPLELGLGAPAAAAAPVAAPLVAAAPAGVPPAAVPPAAVPPAAAPPGAVPPAALTPPGATPPVVVPPAGVFVPAQPGPNAPGIPMPGAGVAPTGPVSRIGQFTQMHAPAAKHTTLGRATDNDIVVNDLLASRHHARLVADGRGGFYIEDLGSFNGTFVNGVRVPHRAQVTEGAVISIAHHLFMLHQGNLTEYLDDGRVTLTALGLTVVASGNRLVDEVSFNLESNSLLAILGPSGAGKSTVMRALTGTQAPNAGSVLYNGRDLYVAYDELRHRIGYVPQDDILHSQLSVRDALSYAARLRFPPDVTDAEKERRIDEVMAELGLSARANLMVSRLSGGQRKRASVALELLTRPSLLTLDEPTSGLDPGYERQVMMLLQTLARSGRTIITITHSTESLDLVDRVLFLAPGGQIAYYGPPAEAKDFFGTPHYPEVFTKLEESPRGAAKAAFAASDKAKIYLEEPIRRQIETAPLRIPPPARAGQAAARVPTPGRQLATLTSRYANIIKSDARNTLLLLAQAPILGLLMLAVGGSGGFDRTGSGNPATVLIFTVLGATYFGAGNAIREIVKERPILVRERAAGLSPGAYLGSKVIVLGLLTILQAILLVLIGTARQGTMLDGFPSGRFELIIIGALTGLAAMAFGLMLSALVSNPDKALTILPVVLLVQFLLSGAMLSINAPVLKQVSYITSARWGYDGATSTADLYGASCQNPVTGRTISSCTFSRVHSSGSWFLDFFMLLLLTVIPLLVAWPLIRRIGVPRHQPLRA